MKVPTGCVFTHIIRGGAHRITCQNAGVDFTYADTGNRTYRTSRGKTHDEGDEINPMRTNSPQTLPR
ncbi:hypothetical protein ACFY0A_19360 [Streptomyces sp. NPDC001698]|uniref:hypothetical protein n=1 Tax=Streptomyces sp. NPDC001698 TaxID=3364601 RepID=UPI003689E794